MAKIEYVKPASEHFPITTEVIEVRFWGTGGSKEQPFEIGSGANFHANGTLWIEIIYSVEGAQIFYTRNFVQHEVYVFEGQPSLESQLDKLVKKGKGKFGFGDILPETFVRLSVEKKHYRNITKGKTARSKSTATASWKSLQTLAPYSGEPAPATALSRSRFLILTCKMARALCAN